MTSSSTSISSSSVSSAAYRINGVIDLWPTPDDSPHLAEDVFAYGHNLSFDEMCLKCAKKYGGAPEIWAKENKSLRPFFKKQRKIRFLKFSIPSVIYTKLVTAYFNDVCQGWGG